MTISSEATSPYDFFNMNDDESPAMLLATDADFALHFFDDGAICWICPNCEAYFDCQLAWERHGSAMPGGTRRSSLADGILVASAHIRGLFLVAGEEGGA